MQDSPYLTLRRTTETEVDMANRTTSRTERTNVEYPLWRKKVDNSIFRDAGTTIPNWACGLWAFDTLYPTDLGKRDPASLVLVTFEGRSYDGHVTRSHPKRRAQRVFRFFFGEDLLADLKAVYLMSYMRDLESRLSDATVDIEQEIPFWEFLDIEFDQDSRAFHLSAHYTQRPAFPELFKRLTYSPVLKRVDDELGGKDEFRVHKQDWRPRNDYEAELGAENVIYTLIDTKNKLLYVGEAQKLIQRFNQGHKPIPHWDFYRYDQLPPMQKKTRVALERMIIRSFAAVLPNRRDISSIELSEYKLANEKIDA